MHGEHSHHMPGAADNRGGVTPACAGVDHYFQPPCSQENGTDSDVRDINRQGGLQGHPAGGIGVANVAKKIQEWLLESSLGLDFQTTQPWIEQLNISHWRSGNAQRDVQQAFQYLFSAKG